MLAHWNNMQMIDEFNFSNPVADLAKKFDMMKYKGRVDVTSDNYTCYLNKIRITGKSRL
ncbi:hypothetical protein PGB90_003773 [Kerria lacca]